MRAEVLILVRFLCNRPQTNYPLQRLPNVEERLLQLEGDKDSLHLQVRCVPIQINIHRYSPLRPHYRAFAFGGHRMHAYFGAACVSSDSTKER